MGKADLRGFVMGGSAIERYVEIFAVIHLSIMGLSHIFAHRAWARFFIRLRDQGEPGVFVVGFMSLGFGSIIAAFHPVWSGWGLVLTLLGWAQVLKALLYFVAPAHGLRMLARVSEERSRQFIVAGFALLLLAALIAYPLLGQ